MSAAVGRGAGRQVVVVTGSGGFTGAALVKASAQRCTVVGFEREVPPHTPADAECVSIHLTDDNCVEAAFRRLRTACGEHIASVVHLAA